MCFVVLCLAVLFVRPSVRLIDWLFVCLVLCVYLFVYCLFRMCVSVLFVSLIACYLFAWFDCFVFFLSVSLIA